MVDGDLELKELNDPAVRTRSRHISFSSTVAETFVVRKQLTENFAASAMQYWKNKGLAIKNILKPDDLLSKGPIAVQFGAEGGTIWTTDFESYKKTVKVDLLGSQEHTKVMVHLMLPGGLMSLQDRERAADLIESFYESLETANL